MAVQRPSSLTATGLTVDGRSSTHYCLSGCREADLHEDRSAADKRMFMTTHSWDDMPAGE